MIALFESIRDLHGFQQRLSAFMRSVPSGKRLKDIGHGQHAGWPVHLFAGVLVPNCPLAALKIVGTISIIISDFSLADKRNSHKED